SASSARPGLVRTAPVKEPASCPNSSLSSSWLGIAGQCTLTKGCCRRGEFAWIQRAIISLPQPLLPWISTGASASAICPRCSRTRRMASEWPKMSSIGGSSCISSRIAVLSPVAVRAALFHHLQRRPPVVGHAGRPQRRPADSVLLHLVHQRLGADAQRLRRRPPVPVGPVQGAVNGPALGRELQ